MKKILMVGLLSATLVSVCLAQSVDWSIRQVRDPVQLKDKLNSDGTTVDGRLDDLEASTNVYIAAGLAAFDVSGFTNGVLPAARIPFAAYSVAGFTNGTLALARFSASLPAYSIAGFTNGTLGAGRLPAMYQADTNATTTPGSYTPGFIGQPLFGAEGSSSRVWFATAATTNGWTLKFNAD